MKSKAPVLLSVVFSLLACFLASSISCLDVSAEEITPSDPADIRSFYGDSIPFTYSFYGVEYSDTFEYLMTKTGGTNVQFSYVSIENNNVATNGYTFGAYDYIVYRCQTGRASAYLTDVSPSGIYTNYSGYVRGGFGMSMFPDGFSVPTNTYNTIADYPNNYVGSNQAQASTNSAYYNWAWMPADYYSSGGGSGYLACRWNLFYSQSGFTVDDITFSGVRTTNVGDLFFVVMCPVYGGDMSNTDPSQTTATTGTMPPSSTIDINVSVNVQVDNSEVVSQLDDYLGGDDTGITTFTQVSFSDVSIDYDILTTEFQIADVIQRTSNGIGAIWGLVSDLIFNIPFLAWLIPFAVIMAILSFVLWRKG